MNVFDFKNKSVIINDQHTAHVHEVTPYGVGVQFLIASKNANYSAGDYVHFSWHTINSIKEAK